jgi:CRP-like cAMP-binding protein
VDRTGILLRTPVFGDLDAAEVERLVPDLVERRFGRGEIAWVEGDPADSLYVVVEGQFKSHRISPDGGEVVLGFNAAVDIMGEVGLFHPSRRRLVSVSAMTPSRCLTVRRPRLLAFLADHPVAMQRMLERLSTIAGRAAHSFSGVAFDDIARRVADALLALTDEFGEPAPGGTRIRLRLSQATLAALIAASRENVNRSLSSLVAGGVVRQQDGHFVVTDRAALQRASSLGKALNL